MPRCTVDLHSLSTRVPRTAARIFGLLYLEARFTHDPWISYADVFRQLSLPEKANRSQVVKRARRALSAALGADFIERKEVGREALLALRQPLSLTMTLRGEPVTTRSLEAFLEIESRPDAPPRVLAPEAEFYRVIRTAVDAERNMAACAVSTAQADITALRKARSSLQNPRLVLLSEIQELRLLRISEQWGALERATDRVELRAEKALRARSTGELARSHAEVLDAAAQFSRAWLLYRRARDGVQGARYEDALERLESKRMREFFSANLWCICERHNLLALVLRRIATAAPMGDADRMARLELAQRSLEQNQHAIEQAKLGGNQHMVATCSLNRAVLLADLAAHGLYVAQNNESPWHAAVRWLCMGDDLSRWLGYGADVSWSGPYLLSIVRYAEGRATWPDLQSQLAQHSRSHKRDATRDLIGCAIEFAQPVMKDMLKEVAEGRGVSRYRRQLFVTCREFAHAAQRDGVVLRRYEALHPLYEWVCGQTRLRREDREVKARFIAAFGRAAVVGKGRG